MFFFLAYILEPNELGNCESFENCKCMVPSYKLAFFQKILLGSQKPNSHFRVKVGDKHKWVPLAS